MGIEIVTLKRMEIIETEYGFEKRFTNEQKVPASITNYSLSMGEKLGLIKSSQITDLADIEQLFRSATDPDVDQEQALKNVDIGKYLKVIYLAIIGINRNIELTYEEFTELYHEDRFTTIETYTNLVLATLTDSVNGFVDGLQSSTKKK